LEQALIEKALNPFLAEVAAERRHQVETIARHVEISLNEMIHRQSLRHADLAEVCSHTAGTGRKLQIAGFDKITPGMAQTQVEDLLGGPSPAHRPAGAGRDGPQPGPGGRGWRMP
jgi:hypothetical protein